MRRRTIFAAKFLVGNYKTSSREQRGSGRMLVCKDYALTPKRERPFETERAGEGVQDPKAMHFVADVSINDVEVLESATCNFFFNILLEKPWKFKAVRRQRAKQTPSGFLTRVTSSAGKHVPYTSDIMHKSLCCGNQSWQQNPLESDLHTV